MATIRNHWILCLCALVMCCFLSACQAPSAEKVQVEIWHSWNVEEGGTEHELKVLVDEYNASQDKVEVLLVSQPSEGFADKVYTSVANGTGPDIFFSFANTLPDYAEANLLADMGSYMDEEALKRRLSDALWSECTGTDGKLHIVPIQTSVPVLFYNKALFDNLGLSVPQTWSDVESAARTIHEQTGIAGFAVDSYIDLAQMLFYQTGATYIDLETKTVGFHTAECAQQLEWFISCVNNGVFATNFESGSIDQDFNAGLLAAFLGTCTYEPYIVPNGFEYAAAPAPTGEGVAWAPIFSRGAIVLASNKTTEAAACDFLAFFVNAQNSARWNMAIGSLSPYSDADQYSGYSEYVETDPVLNAAIETMKYAYTTPAVVGAQTVRNQLKQMFLQVIGGIKPVEEALSETEAACNSALQG